jgi:hypothetical protein
MVREVESTVTAVRRVFPSRRGASYPIDARGVGGGLRRLFI